MIPVATVNHNQRPVVSWHYQTGHLARLVSKRSNPHTPLMSDASRIFGNLHRFARGDQNPIESELSVQTCQNSECSTEAEHKVPADPRLPDKSVWLCREHAREHNAGDYFKDMSRDEIEKFRREDTTGHRPTWKLGANSGTWWRDTNYSDGWADLGGPSQRGPRTSPKGAGPTASGPVQEALSTFQLDATATWIDIKTRYKELVKRHHPDTNGGSKKAESKLKRINQAYGLLKASYGE